MIAQIYVGVSTTYGMIWLCVFISKKPSFHQRAAAYQGRHDVIRRSEIPRNNITCA